MRFPVRLLVLLAGLDCTGGNPHVWSVSGLRQNGGREKLFKTDKRKIYKSRIRLLCRSRLACRIEGANHEALPAVAHGVASLATLIVEIAIDNNPIPNIQTNRHIKWEIGSYFRVRGTAHFPVKKLTIFVFRLE